MRNQYTQLTSEERYHIWQMKRIGQSNREIGKQTGRCHTTISRELKRNTGGNGYRHKQAHEMARQRHRDKPKVIKLSDDLKETVQAKLELGWSPEIICGRLKHEQNIQLHHESLYRWIYADKQRGGELYQRLCFASKPYRKRYGKRDYRGRIPNRVDISERPDVVEERSRVGDWEADTVIGKGHKGGFATLAERKTRLYLALPIANKTAEVVKAAVLKLLTPMADFVKTITYDNGREFTLYEDISEALQCQGFFARPYHSWERGLNEQSNGLLRRFFPKTMALDKVTEDETLAAVEKLNHRPRKCLGYKTPWEAFVELTQQEPVLMS